MVRRLLLPRLVWIYSLPDILHAFFLLLVFPFRKCPAARRYRVSKLFSSLVDSSIRHNLTRYTLHGTLSLFHTGIAPCSRCIHSFAVALSFPFLLYVHAHTHIRSITQAIYHYLYRSPFQMTNYVGLINCKVSGLIISDLVTSSQRTY